MITEKLIYWTLELESQLRSTPATYQNAESLILDHLQMMRDNPKEYTLDEGDIALMNYLNPNKKDYSLENLTPNQKHWAIELTLMYYASGDFKGIYEYAEENDGEEYFDFKEAFNLETDDDVAEFLNINSHLLQPASLRFKPKLHIPQ